VDAFEIIVSLCELIDNALGAGAANVKVQFKPAEQVSAWSAAGWLAPGGGSAGWLLRDPAPACDRGPTGRTTAA
jgi:hypothetical protein